MKKVIKSMPAMLAMLVATLITLTAFTACSDDDESQEVMYTMGVFEMSSSASDFGTHDINTINTAFRKAFGVSDSHFTLTGSKAECDKRVRATCEDVVASLKNTEWGGTYTFQVLDVQTQQVVFEVTFKARDENFI